MPPRCRRRSYFSSVPPMPRRPPSRSRKQPRSVHDPFAILAPRMLMSSPWSETRSRDIPALSPPIPTIPWPIGYAPLLPLVARRSPGGERARSTRLAPTGHICDDIQMDRMRRTRIAVLPILPLPSSRRRHLPSWITTSPRLRPRRSSISVARCSCSATRSLLSRCRLPCQSFYLPHHRSSSWCWLHHLRPLDFSCSHVRCTCRCRFGSGLRHTSLPHQQTTSSTTTFTVPLR